MNQVTGRNLGWFTACVVALIATTAAQAATERERFVLHGDFVLIGQTLGHDCAAGVPTPVVGTIGACGSNTSDTSPDIYWRSDSPTAGQAEANTSIVPQQARSTAILSLPSSAIIRHARLYWTGKVGSGGGDSSATIERPGVLTQSVTAQTVLSEAVSGGLIYLSSVNVTELIAALGPGAIRVGDVDSLALTSANDTNVFSGWWLVVVFEDPTVASWRFISLFDDVHSTASISWLHTLGNLRVAAPGYAQLALVAGDGDIGSDTLQLNSTPFGSGAIRTNNNFFNSSRTLNGVGDGSVGDLPQLSGAALSLSGIDIANESIASILPPGSNQLNVLASLGTDAVTVLGGVLAVDTIEILLSDGFE